MFKNYLITAFRNLKRQNVNSFINIIGLSIGIAAFFIILQYVSFELSYDNFHKNSDNIYRVESQFYCNDVLSDDWGTSSFG